MLYIHVCNILSVTRTKIMQILFDYLTCLLGARHAADQQYTDTTQGSVWKHMHAYKVSLFSENQLWKDNAVPVTDDIANIKTEKAASDVFQVAWITSIDSLVGNRKPLFCNGRRFWVRWVFAFCYIFRAKPGKDALETEDWGECWLGEWQQNFNWTTVGIKKDLITMKLCHASD